MPNVPVNGGAGFNIATNSVTRDAVTEHLQLFNIADSTGANYASVSSTGAVKVDINSEPDTIGTGTITATDAVVAAPTGNGAMVSGASTAGSYVSMLSPGGLTAWNIEITGLTSGTLYFEESLDSTTGADGNWIAVNGRQTGIVNTVLSYSVTTNGVFRGNVSGAKYIRVRAVGALTGTPLVTIRLSNGVGAVFLNASIPAGTNIIGAVQTVPQSFSTVPGTISAIGSTNAISASVTTTGMAQISIHGTYGIGTFQFQASDDSGVTWYPIQGIRSDGTIGEATTGSIAANSSIMWSFGLGGITNIRVYAVTLASGTVNVRITPVGGSVVDPGVFVSGGTITSALPAGTNNIGKMTSSNDATSTTAYAAAATTVIKASAGRLVSVLVTTLGTANCNIYDNASAATGTIIGVVAANTAVGTVLVFAAPAANGITIGGVASNSAFTVMYN